MTIATGIIARCLYLAADLVLYGGVLGYQTAGTRRKTCSAGLFLAGFVCITAIFPTLPYAAWLMYGMLWLGMELLYEKLPVGLVVFVSFFRLTLANITDGISAIVIAGNDLSSYLNWRFLDIYEIILNALYLGLILIFFNSKMRKKLEFCRKVKSQKCLVNAILMSVPVLFSWIWNCLQDPFSAQNYVFVETSLLSFIVAFLAVNRTVLAEKEQELLTQIELNERCIREQTEQYHDLERKQKALRAFRHDLNGHMTALLKLVQEGNPEKTETYLKGLFDIQADSFYISSNNVIGDAIFNEYYEKCKAQGVELQVAGKFDDTLNVAETDLCIILTNTVSNAYEAALKCGHGSQILVDIKQFNHKTLIEITNPVQEPLIIEGGVMVTTKDDKENHGLGIYNTKKAVERNGGLISWEQQGKNIVTKIVI